MVRSRPLLATVFAMLILIMLANSATAAERQYHLDHEWVKIWINQDGTINLLYDISLVLDSGPSVNYVLVGQPQGDFTIGEAMDQYGHVLSASDASSGSNYKVRVNLYEPLVAG